MKRISNNYAQDTVEYISSLSEEFDESGRERLVDYSIELKYCLVYEDYLRSRITNLLKTTCSDFDQLVTVFEDSVICPHKDQAYCNKILSNLKTSLKNAICQLKSELLCPSDQSVYDIMESNSDKLLSDSSSAYIVNFVGGLKSYTSKSYMQNNDMNVVDKLSDVVEKEGVKCYLYNKHWYLVFLHEERFYVIDPNSEDKNKFLDGHKESQISYVPLDIKQDQLSSIHGTCGKICISLKRHFPEFFTEPRPDLLIDLIIQIRSNILSRDSTISKIQNDVLDLVEESNECYSGYMSYLPLTNKSKILESDIETLVNLTKEEREIAGGNSKCSYIDNDRVEFSESNLDSEHSDVNLAGDHIPEEVG